jgi:protein-disulfide isomerase
MNRMIAFAAAVWVGSLLNPVVMADELTAQQKTEVEKIVRDYLLAHPEILSEMSQKLEANQRLSEDAARKQAVTAYAADIFRLSGDVVAGNAKGDVTIVEFMDYNCGWCKRSVAEVATMIENDKNLRVVFKEFPIFGEGSEYAARAALASNKQNAYWKFHQALFANEGQINAESTDAIASQIGLDVAQLKQDMADPAIAETLSRNKALAQSLMLSGTPAFIVDETVVPGYLPHSQLSQAVDAIRTAGGCKLC